MGRWAGGGQPICFRLSNGLSRNQSIFCKKPGRLLQFSPNRCIFLRKAGFKGEHFVIFALFSYTYSVRSSFLTSSYVSADFQTLNCILGARKKRRRLKILHDAHEAKRRPSRPDAQILRWSFSKLDRSKLAAVGNVRAVMTGPHNTGPLAYQATLQMSSTIKKIRGYKMSPQKNPTSPIVRGRCHRQAS